MNKENLKSGMFLKTKNGQYLQVEGDDKLFFRFRDGTNNTIHLDQYDDELNCLYDAWSIVQIEDRNILPVLCNFPKTMTIRNINNNKKYKVYSKRNDQIKFADKKKTETITTRYSFNGEVGSKDGYYTDYYGNVTSDWFNEDVDHYYINHNGKEIEIEEDDFVLVNKSEKLVVSYRYLLDNFVENK